MQTKHPGSSFSVNILDSANESRAVILAAATLRKDDVAKKPKAKNEETQRQRDGSGTALSSARRRTEAPSSTQKKAEIQVANIVSAIFAAHTRL